MFAYSLILQGHYLNWGPPISDDSSLYQVDTKPTNKIILRAKLKLKINQSLSVETPYLPK